MAALPLFFSRCRRLRKILFAFRLRGRKLASTDFLPKLRGCVFVLPLESRAATRQNAFDYDGIASGQRVYAYVGGNPLIFVDPLGLSPDLSICSYYLQQCVRTPNRYYCAAGPLICSTADVNPLFKRDPTATTDNLNCVRACLVKEDAAAHSQKSCPADGTLPNKVIDDYHKKCFAQCGVNPDIYPGVGVLNGKK